MVRKGTPIGSRTALKVAGLWGGIPFYRDASRAKVFWRSIDLNRLDAQEIEDLKKAGIAF